MKSGMLAAEAAYDVVHPSPSTTTTESQESKPESESSPAAADMSAYDAALRSSWIWKDLNEVRNLRPSFNTSLGLWGGVAYSGIDSLFLRGRVPWTFKHAPPETLSEYMVFIFFFFLKPIVHN